METGESKRSGESTSTGSKVAAAIFVALILVGAYFLVCGLAPADLPPDKSSNFIDSIFHNNGVVLAARLLLVSAAVVLAMGGVYIVVSMGIRWRMANGSNVPAHLRSARKRSAPSKPRLRTGEGQRKRERKK